MASGRLVSLRHPPPPSHHKHMGVTPFRSHSEVSLVVLCGGWGVEGQRDRAVAAVP